MVYQTISPEELATRARSCLDRAARLIAESQSQILAATDAIGQFERNFRVGIFQVAPQQMENEAVKEAMQTIEQIAQDGQETDVLPVEEDEGKKDDSTDE